MKEFLAITNALADESRIRLLMGLSGHELCVCKLVDFIELSDSAVSRHMSILKQAGLVESRKKGKWVYYRLADLNASPLVKRALEIATGHLKSDKTIVEDALRINEILSKDDGTSCQTEPSLCTQKIPQGEPETA